MTPEERSKKGKYLILLSLLFSALAYVSFQLGCNLAFF